MSDEWLRAVKYGMEQEHAERYPETWHSFDGRKGILEFTQWAASLPIYIETERVILLHGGMDPNSHFKEQDERELLWSRNMEFIPQEYRDNKRIVHGHTPVPNPLILVDRINIDTGCVYGGHLTALSLDALEEGEVILKSVEGFVRRDAVRFG
ncbi:hypothetical protein [Alicyclobacillus acidoterrestris]|uniref:Uncharacterized protein n=1 Tax=Alicyclobacillus acidoterrestris (strain ATCC 49025 / DSM 3922 / CIP 106132 / NCIMB 13137 / GD3B) TaxID=1356854 RepID=T0D216_ALIAG|nr:hypothetical protein [Alicyclobacillus acidoterrestris]EPZ43806.1 hypothetical protein N007_12190 [Alicyclobacillus acidoterrestris ATCC 49025]UNO50998.1 hypothetical protein K1I37_21250 [Alicyclobacillus acidoterrestris]